MLVYKGYSYMLTEPARKKFDAYVDVVVEGQRQYPCGTKVPIRFFDSVPEWEKIYRDEVDVHGVKIDLFTFQDIYGTRYDAVIQQVAVDPRDNGDLLVFLGFQAPNGCRPPKLQWSEAEIAQALRS